MHHQLHGYMRGEHALQHAG